MGNSIEDDDDSFTKPLGRRSVIYYGMGHMLNDITAACWFTYLLLFLTDIGLSPRYIYLITWPAVYKITLQLLKMFSVEILFTLCWKRTIYGRKVVFILGNVEFGNKGFIRYKFYMLFGKGKSSDRLPDSNSYSLQHDEILVLRYSDVSKQFISSTH